MGRRDEYEWDVFVSYRYFHGLTPWLDDHFVPLLGTWLGQELDPPPRIFHDRPELHSRQWTSGLATALAGSAVLVPLLSKNYFASGYCRAEFDHMIGREVQTGYAAPGRPLGLVLPGIVHDCNPMPVQVGPRNCPDFYPYVLSNLAPRTPTAEDLEKEIKNWAPAVAQAVTEAPPRRERWLYEATTAMEEAYDLAPARQETVPGRRPR